MNVLTENEAEIIIKFLRRIEVSNYDNYLEIYNMLTRVSPKVKDVILTCLQKGGFKNPLETKWTLEDKK